MNPLQLQGLPFVALAMVVPMSGCDQAYYAVGRCPLLAGRDPVADARQDHANGERYLLTDIRTGGDVHVFIPNYDDKSCAFMYDNAGDMLRINSRKLPLMTSSDVLSSEEAICRDASSVCRRAYNVKLSRLDPGAYNATCSALTPEPARRELGLDADHTMVEAK